MGLLSFFSKKSSQDNNKLEALKAQPYHATVASLPPVIGTYPVHGNGPSVLETGRRYKTQESQAQAPAFIGREDVQREAEEERPRTAPLHGRPQWLPHPRSDSLKSPPVPSLKGPPYRLADKVSDSLSLTPKQRAQSRLSSTVPESVPLTKPTLPFSHRRRGSSQSNPGSFTGGFVDLLDAQSNFIPTDFRDRLRAAGARDYGEDVADRNIGENGVDLDSPEAKAFYDSSTNTSAPAPARRLSMAMYKPDQSESRARRHYSFGSNVRTKSLNSDRNLAHRSADGRPNLEDHSQKKLSVSTKADRRRSLPAYAASPQTTGTYAREIEEFPQSLRIKGKDLARIFHDTEQGVHVRPRSSHRRPTSSKQSKGPAALSKENRHSLKVPSHEVTSATEEPEAKAIKASRRETVIYSSKIASSQSPSKRLSLQSLKSLATNQNTIRDTSRQVRPQSPETDSYSYRSRLESANSIQDPPPTTLQLTAFKSAHPKHAPKGKDNRDTLKIKTRLHPQVPVFSPDRSFKLHELEDSIPDRTSSLRNLSIDSTSGTISSLSSSPFRTQSRHTASTSVDLAPFGKGINSSFDSLSKTSYRTAPESLTHSPSAMMSVSSPRSPLGNTEPLPAFNIDDYISSDSESGTSSCQAEDPEDLLFLNSGYGFQGAELPGLTGLLDATATRTPPLSPLRPPSLRPQSLSEQTLAAFYRTFNGLGPQGVENLPGPRGDRRQEDSDRDSVSDQELLEYQDHLRDGGPSFNIPRSRHDATLQQYRNARYATREEDIEEEREFEKFDISTAVRLRKEAKRRNRLSGSTVRKRKDKGKEKVGSRRQHIGPEDSEADDR